MTQDLSRKSCPNCEQIKPLEDFYTDRKMKSGRESWCKSCRCASAREFSKKHRVHLYFKQRERRYGVNEEEYNEMLKKQKGVCAICGNISKHGRRLCIDHDKNTLEVRGLLCDNCNVGLGLMLDNPTTLRKAADYLEK